MPMPVYPDQIASLIRTPRFACRVAVPNAIGTEAKLDCGCFVRVEMDISEGGRIEEVAFQTNGCGYMVAAAESMANSINGRSLTELSGLLEVDLNVSFDRSECTPSVLRAFKRAFAVHRTKQIEEFRGEKALICTCFGTTEESVEEFVVNMEPNSVEDVTFSIRAGGGCGSCRMLIQEIIDEKRRSRVL